MNMDKGWMSFSRRSNTFKEGVENFLDFAFANASIGNMILCPCKNCKNAICVSREDARSHLICDGFIKGYTKWLAHGELSSSLGSQPHSHHTNAQNATQNIDDMQGLLQDVFRPFDIDTPMVDEHENESARPNKAAETFYKMIEDTKTELFPGCNRVSKLSFIIRMLHMKCVNKWSDKSFQDLLNFLSECFPDGAELPKSYYEMKKVMKDLGLGYEQYDACINDCMLYWGVDEGLTKCKTCGEPRWLRSEENPSGEDPSKKGIAAKCLWHFPLKPRLQRLFMSPKTASFMRWHAEERKKDGKMRHPADSPAWQTFDYQNKEFAKDARNVRLGLASDGFNPFRTMSVAHSTWPVVLMPYNLPPGMCMKEPYFLLSLLIPGPTAPGNNIDVYLQPLINELKELWEEGVDTYDASLKQNFKMHAALLWTINDFPGYANLSGWSTKGEFACPTCNEHTSSKWLRHSRKFCYMGHRRFLHSRHPFRKDKQSFDGTQEHRTPPSHLSGSMIMQMLENFNLRFGKKVTDNPKLPFNWKKKSIFFELPYWKDNMIRHNLDVMHIEKNVFDNVINTLLNLDKSKDHLHARLDLQDMGIRQSLHPQQTSSNKPYLPAACFSMSKKEKTRLCRVLKKVKVPDGYAANISRCVHLNPPKISGLKSHDNHILMQQLFPLALRKLLPKPVRRALLRFCKYFKDLCGKVLEPRELAKLEVEIIETLCQLEKIFPPSFFDIMIHLSIHLAGEARMAGPVHYRWMYPIERYLSKLKSYVRNRSRPEGCIAEGYIAEECLTFCSLYLSNEVETKFNKVGRNEDDFDVDDIEGLQIFSKKGFLLGGGDEKVLDEETLAKAHRYVLFNCDTVTPFVSQHFEIIQQQNPRMGRHELERVHSETFATWFSSHVQELCIGGDESISNDLNLLSRGPSEVAKEYKGMIVNGFRFHTKRRERKRKTQNSGVIVTAGTSSFSSSRDENPIFSDVTYYGVLKNILELDYTGGKRVVLFECDWVSKGKRLKQDNDGFIMANFTNVKRHNEPFILASQAGQVFYVEDPDEAGWHVVVKTSARAAHDEDSTMLDAEMFVDVGSENVESFPNVQDIVWVREDVRGSIIVDQVQLPMEVHMDNDDINL